MLGAAYVSDAGSVSECFAHVGTYHLLSASIFDSDRDFSIPCGIMLAGQPLDPSLFADDEDFYTLGDNDLFYSPSIS
jgi:hypothetical protein